MPSKACRDSDVRWPGERRGTGRATGRRSARGATARPHLVEADGDEQRGEAVVGGDAQGDADDDGVGQNATLEDYSLQALRQLSKLVFVLEHGPIG